MSFRPDASNDKHNKLQELRKLRLINLQFTTSYQRKMFSRGMFLKSKSSIDNF